MMMMMELLICCVQLLFPVGSSDASSYELDTQSCPPLIGHQATSSNTNAATLGGGGSENAACDDNSQRNSLEEGKTCVVTVSDVAISPSVTSRMAFQADSQACSERMPLAECDVVALASEVKHLEIDLSLNINNEYSLYDEPSINDLRHSPSTLSFLP